MISEAAEGLLAVARILLSAVFCDQEDSLRSTLLISVRSIAEAKPPFAE
jgi:hypothetical protein